MGCPRVEDRPIFTIDYKEPGLISRVRALFSSTSQDKLHDEYSKALGDYYTVVGLGISAKDQKRKEKIAKSKAETFLTSALLQISKAKDLTEVLNVAENYANIFKNSKTPASEAELAIRQAIYNRILDRFADAYKFTLFDRGSIELKDNKHVQRLQSLKLGSDAVFDVQSTLIDLMRANDDYEYDLILAHGEKILSQDPVSTKALRDVNKDIIELEKDYDRAKAHAKNTNNADNYRKQEAIAKKLLQQYDKRDALEGKIDLYPQLEAYYDKLSQFQLPQSSNEVDFDELLESDTSSDWSGSIPSHLSNLTFSDSSSSVDLTQQSELSDDTSSDPHPSFFTDAYLTGHFNPYDESHAMSEKSSLQFDEDQKMSTFEKISAFVSNLFSRLFKKEQTLAPSFSPPPSPQYVPRDLETSVSRSSLAKTPPASPERAPSDLSASTTSNSSPESALNPPKPADQAADLPLSFDDSIERTDIPEASKLVVVGQDVKMEQANKAGAAHSKIEKLVLQEKLPLGLAENPSSLNRDTSHLVIVDPEVKTEKSKQSNDAVFNLAKTVGTVNLSVNRTRTKQAQAIETM